MKKLLITTILVLSCAECFSQDPRKWFYVPDGLDFSAQDTFSNHDFWFNKELELDLTNGAINSTRDQYHVVVKIGSTYTSNPLVQKPEFNFRKSQYEYRRKYKYQVWIPATVEISPHNNPTASFKLNLLMESCICFNNKHQVLMGRLSASKEFMFSYGHLGIGLKGTKDSVYPNLGLRYYPPSGKTRLRDNVSFSYNGLFVNENTHRLSEKEIAW